MKTLPFEGIAGGAVALPGHGSEQIVRGPHRLLTGVEQEKTAGAVRVLGQARLPAALPEGGGLLVAGNAAERDGPPKGRRVRLAVDGAGGADFRQHGAWDAQPSQQRLIPIQGMDVEQHGARGIRDVREMQAPTGQAPEQEGIDGAEGQLAAFGARPRLGYMLQQPVQLGG